MSIVSISAKLTEQNEFTFGNPMLHLNEFVGIALPEAVVFQPLTWGWLLLLVVVSVISGRYVYLNVRHWLDNRYRKRAVVRLNAALNLPLTEFSTRVLQEIKRAAAEAYGGASAINLVALSSFKRVAADTLASDFPADIICLDALQGRDLLTFLDLTSEDLCAFNTALGDAWLHSLLTNVVIEEAVTVKKNLLQQASIWLMQHSATLPQVLNAAKESEDA